MYRLAYHCSKSATTSDDQRQKACKYYAKAADFALGQRASTLAYEYCLAAFEMSRFVGEYVFLEKVVKRALLDLDAFTSASERNSSLSMTNTQRHVANSNLSSTSSTGAPQRQSSLSLMLSHFTMNEHPQSRDEIDKNNFHALLGLIAQKIVQINMANNPNNTLTEGDKESSASTNLPSNRTGNLNQDIKFLDKVPTNWKLSYTESKPVEHKHSGGRKSVIQGATDMLDKITNRNMLTSSSSNVPARRIPSEGSYGEVSDQQDSTVKELSSKEKEPSVRSNKSMEGQSNQTSTACIIS